MKKPVTPQLAGTTLMLFLLQAVLSVSANAQITYTWTNSTGNSNWQIAANWSPSRTTPAANDVLLFNSGVNLDVRNVPVSETIGQLQVTNNTILNVSIPIPFSTGAVHSLHLSGLPGDDDLLVNAGSSLIFADGTFADKLNVFLDAGATAKILGSLGFYGNGYTLDAADAGSISFEAGSNCGVGVAGTVPSNVFSDNGTPNTVVFKNGSTFNQGTGSTSFGLAAPLSKIVFEPNSNYIAGNRSNLATNSLSGRTFGNLTLGMASLFSATTFTGSLPLTIHNLTIAIIGPGYSLNLTGGITITGDILAEKALTFDPASTSTVNFNGSSVQNIYAAVVGGFWNGKINFGANAKVKIDNPSGVVVAEGTVGPGVYHGDITLNSELDLTAGVFTFQQPAVLTLSSAASVINASAASYVDGLVKKEGNTAFTFPVGKSVIGYAPIAISAPANITDAFTAEYKRSSAQAISTSYTAGLHHVSSADYWTLDRTAGSSSVDVTAYWTPQSSVNGSPGYINNISSLRLAHYNSGATMWDSYGGTANAGSTVFAGSVTWTGVNSFSPFALGSIDNSNLLSEASGGALPVSINYLYGAKQNGSNILHWQVTASNTGAVNMELQKRNSNNIFAGINAITASAQRCLLPFEYTDVTPAAGANYYRLKITDADGKIHYSNTTVIFNTDEGFDVMNIAPSVVSTAAVINISAAQKTKLTITVINGSGKKVQQHNYTAIAGSSQFLLNAANLPAGIYYVNVMPEKGEGKTLKFVK